MTLSDDQLSKNIAKYSLLLDKLSTLSQVKKLSNVINADYVESSKSLTDFIQDNQLHLNRQLRRLELQRTDLTSTLTGYHDTLSVISSSHMVAKQIYNQINSTDQEHSHLKKTLSFLCDIRTLKNNIFLIENAIKESNYLVAATAINEIDNLDPSIINSKFAKAIIPTEELPLTPSESLNIWKEQLRSIFIENFNKAVNESNIEILTFYFKLFPLIGEPTIGLDLYSKYITDMISQENKKFTMGAMKYSGGFHLVLLNLFKIASTILNEHSKIIDKAYGIDHMIVVMEKVEVEVELQASLVLNYFKDEKLDKFNKSDYKSLINEFSQLFQNWSMYSRFFSVRWSEFSGTFSQDTPLQVAPALLNGAFNRKLDEENYLNRFEQLILDYLNKSFQKSISLEELPSLNELIVLRPITHTEQSSWPISSVIEDLTLLIKQDLIYTLNAGQFSVFSNFLDQLYKFIQNEFLVNFIQAKFKSLQSRLNATSTTVSLKRYVPKENSTASRLGSPSKEEPQHMTTLSQLTSDSTEHSKLSQFSKFNLRGAFANIQSNLQSVVVIEDDDESILALHHYLVYINTLYFLTLTMEKLLITDILTENVKLLPDNFPFESDSEVLKEKIENTNELIKVQNNKLQVWSLKYLFQNIILVKVRTLLNNVFINGDDHIYVSGAEDFEDLTNMNDFVTKWKTLMIPYENVLFDEGYHELLKLTVNFIVKFIEHKFWNLEVNELGAVKLDRELSLFISTICGLNYTLRERFTKLTQIVLILGFDDDDFDIKSGDIKEELISTIDWVLNPQDRIKTRELRIDKRH